MAYKNPEDRRAYRRRYRAKHRKRINAYARAYSARRRAKFPSHMRSYKRRYDLRRKYGLTEDGFQRILLQQRRGCAVCGTKSPGSRGWHIDHSHRTQAVRGVLCSPCNLMLGLAKDSASVLRGAIRYLKGQT